MSNTNQAGGGRASASQVSSATAIVVVVVVVLVIVAVGWWWMNKPGPKPTNAVPAGTQQAGNRTPRPLAAN